MIINNLNAETRLLFLYIVRLSFLCSGIKYKIMNDIELFLTVEITNLNDDLRRQWEYLSDEVQYRKLDNIEPFLIHIRKLEARKTHLNMMIERARANEA